MRGVNWTSTNEHYFPHAVINNMEDCMLRTMTNLRKIVVQKQKSSHINYAHIFLVSELFEKFKDYIIVLEREEVNLE